MFSVWYHAKQCLFWIMMYRKSCYFCSKYVYRMSLYIRHDYRTSEHAVQKYKVPKMTMTWQSKTTLDIISSSIACLQLLTRYLLSSLLYLTFMWSLTSEQLDKLQIPYVLTDEGSYCTARTRLIGFVEWDEVDMPVILSTWCRIVWLSVIFMLCEAERVTWLGCDDVITDSTFSNVVISS